MQLYELIIPELQHEAGTTRKMLARVPQDALAWQPHDKSMTLGRLAAHIANLPNLLVKTLTLDEFDTNDLRALSPGTDDAAGIVAAFERNVAAALQLLPAQSDERLLTTWRYYNREQLLFEMPRLAVIRFAVINHIIHHRGQLSVYLRLRDVPLPSAYGPTADEA